MVQRSAVTMHLTSPQSHGFLRRIRSHISEASTGWESHDLSSNFKSTDPSVSTFDLNQFYSAVKSGNKEKVKEILDQHPEILESKDVHQNNTALHLAVINSNADMVQILARRSKSLYLTILIRLFRRKKEKFRHFRRFGGERFRRKHCPSFGSCRERCDNY
jgi:Ankyrin repeats (3 copies)